MTLTTGQMVQNRYQIIARLGQGGMGAVYRAWDTRLSVPVAIKEMVPQPGLDQNTLAQLRQQFWQEAAVLARLVHPHLVRVTDFFEEGGNTYLVMDFIEGESLAQRIAQQGALPEAQVLTWSLQLLDALAYCHSQGVIHRDIKPQNVIIRADGRAVLVDFGLVKLWDPSDPRTKTVMHGMGTPEYAPPEQYDVDGGHTDPRADIYSLGATLYHALTGQAPPTATMRMAAPEQFKPLRQLVPGVSQRTETVVTRALELSRARRWQSAVEMAQALRAGAPTARPTAVVPPPTAATPSYRPSVAAPPTAPPLTPTGPAAPSAAQRRGLPGWTWALIAIGGLIAVVIGAIFACGLGASLFGGGTPPPPTVAPITPLPPVTPVPTRPVLPPTNPAGRTATIIIYNRSSVEICYLYISPSRDTMWGANWLEGGETIPVNGNRLFALTPDTYDLRVDDCDHHELEVRWNVSITGLEAWDVTGTGSEVALNLINNSGQTICFVYIVPADSTDWGVDWLGPSEVIVSGTRRTFSLPPGTYNLRLEDCNHNRLVEEQGVEISRSTNWTISP